MTAATNPDRHVCRICGTPVRLQGVTDHVGRQTSDVVWVHWGESDHEVLPPYEVLR